MAAKRFQIPAALRRITPGRWSAYAGLVLCAAGFGLLAVAWGKIAGELNVALQLPYLVSAGFTGLGLIMVGLAVLFVAVNRLDNRRRDAQLRQIVLELRELRASMDTSQHNGSRPERQPAPEVSQDAG